MSEYVQLALIFRAPRSDDSLVGALVQEVARFSAAKGNIWMAIKKTKRARATLGHPNADCIWHASDVW